MSLEATIVFDGGILGAGPPTGVARAFLDALAAYAETSITPPLLLLPPQAEGQGLAHVRELRSACVAGPLARQLRLPSLLRALDAELFHAPIAAIPWRAPCRTIATVHDLPWRARDLSGEPGCGWRARFAVRCAVARADLVIVPSRATERDLRAECPTPRARIAVVAHGVPAAPDTTPSAHDGPFLALGDDRPRKNLARLAAAHERARHLRPSLPALEFVGPRRREANAGWVSEAEKHARLGRARALVHVSLHEGFGLPLLEAMARGTPVLCSDRASLPELAGDAALVVDPTDVEAIAAALVRIDADEALRARLVAAGHARAAAFPPAATAAAWRRLHEDLLR